MEESIALLTIIDIFSKEGFIINDNNVVFCKEVPSIDVILKCSDIKKNGSIFLIYTCHVSSKNTISKREGVNIFDKDDLKALAFKYSKRALYNYLK
jgi:hypothetical protein